MRNVYIDPFSHVFLGNELFNNTSKFSRDDGLLSWEYLKNACQRQEIQLATIDFWDARNASAGDVYVSLEYKGLLKRMLWRRKNKKYPAVIDFKRFQRKILIHQEPPMVTPQVYKNIEKVIKPYDKAYFSCKMNDDRIGYFQTPQPYNNVLPEYFSNRDRKFLVMINVNKKPRPLRLLTIYTRLKPKLLQRELMSERIRAIDFFSKQGDIVFDLYGEDWDKMPPFPHWFKKKSIQKAYRGDVPSKHQKLSEYTFAIAFENCIVPGYLSEKLFDCFFAGTIPIYLGAPDIENYVPKECFIDMRDFKNYEELKTFLKSLNAAQIDLYRDNARMFLESEQYKPFTKEHFVDVFMQAVLGTHTQT